MIQLYADKVQLRVKKGEPITSGSVNAFAVSFGFSPDWDGLTRTVLFRAGGDEIPCELGGTNELIIPKEVLEQPDVRLEAGVYGSDGTRIVLPTIWASLGVIQEGVPAPDGSAQPPDIDPVPGTIDHRALTHRDAAQQHPISAIDGLEDEIRRIPAPVEPITNQELEDLLQ